MFYLIIFGVLVLGSLLELTNISKYSKLFLEILFFFILFSVSGLRYETGGDWTAYTDVFNHIEPLGKVIDGDAPYFRESYMEFGYKLLNSVVKECGGGIQTVFLIVALFNSCLLFLSLKTYVRYPLIGVLIYFGSIYFFLDMVVTRQSVAVIISFFAIRFIKNRELIRYFLAIAVACMFHRSAILMFPLYFILYRDFGKKGYVTFFSFSIFIFLFQIKWMTWLLVFVAKMVGGSDAGIISVYVTSSAYGVSRAFSVGTVVNIILFFIYIYKRSELIKIPYFVCFFNLFMLNIATYFVFYEFIEISNRYRYYFLMSNVVLLPYLLIVSKKYVEKFTIWLLITGFSFLYGKNVFLENPNSLAYNPYQNYVMHLLFNTQSTGKERLKKTDEEFIKSRRQK